MGKKQPRQESEGLVPIDEVARSLWISRQRVYQLEASALRKLRKGLAARGYGPEDIADLPGWLTAYWLDLL